MNGFRWFIVIAAAGALALTSVYFARSQSPAAEYARLKSCFDSPQPEFECLDRSLRAILRTESAGKTMKKLEEQLTLGQCHTAGHVVGQITYDTIRSTDAAIAACPGTCSTSCLHGASGEALRRATGIGSATNAHPNLDLITSEGKKLCKIRDACHAIGHVLFQYYGDLGKALATCDVFGATCYRGVFMEDFFLQMPDSETVRTDRPFDPDNILYPCDTLADRYRQACYHFLSFNQNHFFDENNVSEEKRLDLRYDARESIESHADQASCFEGFGYYSLTQRLSGNSAIGYCARPSALSSRTACSFGLGHALGAFEREEEAYRACAGLKETAVKRACYQGFFDGVVQRSRSVSGDFCETTEDPACRSALADYLRDPEDLEFPLDLGIPAKSN